MNFTYIIPFKYSDDRLLTLTKVLDNIRNINDCEIIIIEQGLEPILPSKNLLNVDEKYIFLYNSHPFNKSWAMNVAWKQAKNDVIVFGDADNLIDINNLLSAIEEMEDYDFISPHIRLIDLSPDENSLSNSEIFKINRPGRGELDHQKLPMCGAMTIFTRDALEKVCGFCQEYFGWGAEDDAMTIKVKHFLKWKEIDNNCYHLWHERVVPDMSWYQRNLQIYTQYKNATKEQLEQHIKNTLPNIGHLDRY
jgi:glycosyltransferase involved in cell wall biosynthesis